MSNHFHLLIKAEPGDAYSDKEIHERVESFYGKSMDLMYKTIEEFRAQLSNISEYVKQIKQSFS